MHAPKGIMDVHFRLATESIDTHWDDASKAWRRIADFREDGDREHGQISAAGAMDSQMVVGNE